MTEAMPFLQKTILLSYDPRTSVPGILQQSFISIGNLMVQGVINSFGTVVIGAFSAVSKINTFAVQLFTTVSNAISAFTAQNIGAGRPDRVKQGWRQGMVLNLGLALCFSLIYILASDAVIGIFVSEGSLEIVETGRSFLRLVPWFYCVVCLKLSCDGVLHGAGAARMFMATTLLDLILRVALSYLLSPHLGYYGVWISWPIGWTLSAALSLWFYLRGRWKTAFQVQ